MNSLSRRKKSLSCCHKKSLSKCHASHSGSAKLWLAQLWLPLPNQCLSYLQPSHPEVARQPRNHLQISQCPKMLSYPPRCPDQTQEVSQEPMKGLGQKEFL